MPRGEKTQSFQRSRSATSQKEGRWQDPELGRWDERMGEEANPDDPTHFRDPDVAINEHLQPPDEGKLAALHVRGPFGLFDNIRSMVSRYKLRYLADGFNLDLRYITPRIIAMGYPAAGGMLEKATRNHVDEVERFIAAKHRDKALVMNLVGEANACMYDFEKFNVNQDCAFLDHGVPSMTIMQRYCQEVDKWLEADPAHVIITHCKAGKGRSGVMICVYLLFKYPELFSSATDVMRFYSFRRMKLAKEALTVPSQRRYIGYFSQRFAAQPGAAFISRLVIPNMYHATHTHTPNFNFISQSASQPQSASRQ